MRRFVTALCSIAIALAAGSTACEACLNDIELPQHEREFRSQYEGQPSPLRTRDSSHALNPTLVSASGWALIAGAAVLALRKPKARPE